MNCAPTVSAADLSDPARLAAIKQACRPEIAAAVSGMGLSAGAQDAVLATLLAYRFAPYGGSTALTFEDILDESVLDCDNYIMLAGHILSRLGSGVELHYVGFDGGVFGNHAQAIYTDTNGSVLLDPTVGLFGVTTFNDLLKGKPVALIGRDARAPEAVIATFHATVLNAIGAGQYQPSDLLYSFHSQDEFIAFFAHADPFLTSDPAMYLRHFPTPGGEALRQRAANN